jgi:contact-dependent growth inhibition (CDI) system CdiI-like immunity protein
MTRLDKSKTKAAPVQAPIAAEDYPTLGEFFSAYLHQDFRNEYGSATKAAKHYLVDASPDEGQALRDEWQKLREKLAGQPLPVIQAAVRKLGAAWLPDSEAALKQIDAALA